MVWAFECTSAVSHCLQLNKLLWQSKSRGITGRVCARRKLRWRFQKLSMLIARMSCPRLGPAPTPHNSFLTWPAANLLLFDAVYHSFKAPRLFISLQTASKQSVAFH